ncbi:MAG: plasmid pRiA4b ORF-3 family protein [Gordonia sp. (in: high G+C Gram-positive bacteria)]
MASLIALHVELEDVDPPITRDLLVDGSLSLADLHCALQIAFGWRDYHAHMFTQVDQPGPGPGTRIWSDPAVVLGPDVAPESEAIIAEVLAGGPLAYDYDFGDCWRHRITAAAPTSAIGAHRLVALVAGSRRGPFEDAGGPAGYAEKLAVLADPEDPDHAGIADWAAEMIGPWFPPAPETCDVASIQAELDDFFGYGADHRDPGDMSGLVLADDVRDPGDLQPDALLADFAAGLPVFARSEFRQYVRRTGLLEPVTPSAEVRAQLTAPFAWLLEAVGPEGLALSKAGWLPPAVVLDGMTSLGWHEPRIGSSTREQSTPPLAALREAATRLGLVRVLKGRLVRTGHGNRAAAGPDALWDSLVARILERLSPGAQVAGTALLLTYADGRPPAGLPDRTWRDVAFVLEVCGWAPSGPSDEFDWGSISAITRPVETVLDCLGSTQGKTGWPPHRGRDPHLADFARAVLHGPAAIRSATVSRHR